MSKGEPIMRTLLRGVVPVAVVALAVAFAQGAERKFDKSFTVASGGTLSLATDVGSVTVTGGSGNEVTVHAELRGRGRDVEEFEIAADQSGNDVKIKGRARKGGGWFWNSVDLDVTYTVKVPRTYSVNIHTSGGDVDISALSGSVDGGTSGGDIRARDIEGKIDLRTSGGNVHAENVKGDVHMETSGGEVAIRNVTGSVEVSTSGGNVSVGDVEGKVSAETSGGDVTVRVKKGNGGVYAETSGGDVEIAINPDVAATIDASTSGGEVTCELPITVSGKLDGSSIHGKLNGGGNLIHARTSGGNIRLRATK
jgi:DUF4097 and DUF4098 domain-containing protein YvlB